MLMEARVTVSPAAPVLYWSGFIDEGTLRLGKGDSSSFVSSSGERAFYLSGLDLGRTSPFGTIPYLEQVVLRVNSELPLFRDAHASGHPLVQDLVRPIPNAPH